MVLISELLEEISRNPPAIGARKILVEHYITIGWLDAATENVQELQRHAPGDSEVDTLLKVLSRKPAPPETKPKATIKPSSSKPLGKTTGSKFSFTFGKEPKATVAPLQGDLDAAQQEFAEGHEKLRVRAKHLIGDLLRLKGLQRKHGLSGSNNTHRIQRIADGDGGNVSAYKGQPPSARATARNIKDHPKEATDLAIRDLVDMMEWLRGKPGTEDGTDHDTVREALVKRVHAIQSALPEALKLHPEIALMHIQHEHLGKTYANDETMLGDAVKDIPRETFYVTEDNYAWDMEELAQAITANGGIMRNPLSRQMFTPKDIRAIVTHPNGKRLAALQVKQHEMAKGVRLKTVDEMEKLAKVLLDDQSMDAMPSRHAVDEFLAYIATLPESEQKALDGLKCPAKDSHTGHSYDFAVGEAVRDAKGNRVCFHKTGDFLKQAAAYLRKKLSA